MSRKNKKKFNWTKELKLTPGYIILILWVVFTFVLLGWVFAASLSTTREIFNGTLFQFETGFHWENYVNAWTSSNVSIFFTNSLLYAGVSTFVLILICAPAAYGLARFKFAGNKLLQNSLVSAMGVPAVMIVLPLFSIVARLDLLNNNVSNRIVMIILYIGINIPFTTVYLLSSFANMSTSYEQAAAIDGSTPAQTFWRVMFPMAQSGVITVSVFNFINIWNEYFMSLIFASSDEVRNVGVGLNSMINSMKYTGNWSGMFASVVILFIPTLIIYLIFYRQIITGLSEGGLKG